MRRTEVGLVGFAGCVTLLFALAATASAASSLSNALSGFTGNSTQASTQSVVGAAGMEFSSTAGLADDFTSDPAVAFDASGAKFGIFYSGDGGRNYMRTIASDYATVSFVAEVTVEVDTLLTDNVFFGMGSGGIGVWGVPDVFHPESSVFMTMEDGNFRSFLQAEGEWITCGVDWCSTLSSALVGSQSGTHRLRQTFDKDANTWFGEVDVDYAGGPFVADAATQVHDTTLAFTGILGVGWPDEPSRVYFGGDDGAIFRDLSIRVIPEPTTGVLIVAGVAMLAGCGKRARPSASRTGV